MLRVSVVDEKRAELEERLAVTSWREGVWLSYYFSPDDIDDTFHEIAHLWGCLHELLFSDARPQSAPEAEWRIWVTMRNQFPMTPLG